MRKIPVVIAGCLLVALCISPVALSDDISYTGTPIGQISSGTGTPTQDSAFSATLIPGRSAYTPPSGAPTTWTGEADGAIWKAARLADQAPPVSTWSKVVFGVGTALAGVQAFNTGLWIGGIISKHFLFGGGSATETVSPAIDSLPSNYESYFEPSDPSAGGLCNYFGNIPSGNVCFVTSNTGAGAWNVSMCAGATITIGDTENFGGNYYSSGHCNFADNTTKSYYLKAWEQASAFANSAPNVTVSQTYNGGCYGGVCAYPFDKIYTDADTFAKWLEPRPDPAAPSQPGSTDVIATWTYPGAPTTAQLQTAAACLLSSSCAGNGGTTVGSNPAVDRENCTIDPTYCPGGADSPTAIPLLQPQANETYSDYIARLQAEGWVGNATTTEESSTLDGYGPSAVTRVIVEPFQSGTETVIYDPLTWPNTSPLFEPSQDLEIRYNPDTAPPVAVTPPPSSCSTCAIDWSPIENLNFGTSFPFGIPSWIASFFGGFNFNGSCPTLSISKPDAIGGGTEDVSFCSADWENTWRPIVFPVLEALMTIAGVVFFSTKILGFGNADS